MKPLGAMDSVWGCPDLSSGSAVSGQSSVVGLVQKLPLATKNLLHPGSACIHCLFEGRVQKPSLLAARGVDCKEPFQLL